MSLPPPIEISEASPVLIKTAEGKNLFRLEELNEELLRAALPVRRSKPHKRQRNMPGQWFSTTNQDLVRYDSLLERDWIIIKDFDPGVTRILEQPFEIDLSSLGPGRAHTPDFLTWDRSDGITVCDVKPADLSLEPGFQVQVAETKRLCEFLGWDYQVLMEPDPQVLTNLRWLSGYRERPEDFDDDRSKILAALDDGQAHPIDVLLGRCELPILGRTMLMYLLWEHVLEVDLSLPINPKSLIRKVE